MSESHTAIGELFERYPDLVDALPAPEDVGQASDLLTLGSLSPAFPDSLHKQRISDLETGVLAWVGEECEHVSQLAGYQIWDEKLKAAAGAMQSVLEAFDERSAPLENDFALRHQASLIRQRQQGLLAEAQLQLYAGSLSDAELQCIKQAVHHENTQQTACLELCIEAADAPVALSGVVIFTSAQAPQPEEPALLFVPGIGGGLQKFASLQTLKQRVRLTMRSGLETPLWRHVPAWKRKQAMAGEVQLITRAITAHPIAHGIEAQLAGLDAAFHYAQAAERFFDEAPTLRDTLIRLFREAADNMAVPVNEVRRSRGSVDAAGQTSPQADHVAGRHQCDQSGSGRHTDIRHAPG